MPSLFSCWVLLLYLKSVCFFSRITIAGKLRPNCENHVFLMILMIFDDFCWFLMIPGGFWWFLMVSDSSWRFLMLADSFLSIGYHQKVSRTVKRRQKSMKVTVSHELRGWVRNCWTWLYIYGEIHNPLPSPFLFIWVHGVQITSNHQKIDHVRRLERARQARRFPMALYGFCGLFT